MFSFDQTMNRHQPFLEHLARIESAIESVCRRYHCSADEAEEFDAEVKARLIAEDCAVLAKFKGGSSFDTYLNTVIQHFFLDWRNRRWGKWRPSACARRLGPIAVRFEQLSRDGYTFDQACSLLRTNHGVSLSDVELARLVARLPPRQPRRMEGEDWLAELLSDAPTPDDRLLAEERRRERRRVLAALAQAVGRLAPEDRLLLRLRFQSDVQMAALAARRGVEPKRLYRRLERILRRLRRTLEREGVRPEIVAEILRAADSER
jgi:RNA polymerase sigma factor for flagellar operon FliA